MKKLLIIVATLASLSIANETLTYGHREKGDCNTCHKKEPVCNKLRCVELIEHEVPPLKECNEYCRAGTTPVPVEGSVRHNNGKRRMHKNRKEVVTETMTSENGSGNRPSRRDV